MSYRSNFRADYPESRLDGVPMAVRLTLVAGRYRLLEPVGTGGMGRVWVARDEMLDRDVAVKEFVPPEWMTDDEKDKLRDRTLREARSAARLNHPHVVRIYDVVHAEGLPWIVMEYVPSRSLHQVIAQDGPFAPEAAARIGLHVLDALTAAHRAGVLHRDVKPHNVLIGPDNRVVLTDFGLATFVDDGAVTGSGLVVGSPQYVSPERARDGASTVESDLWSFGATLYAAVEGRSPYARDSAMATLMALATEPPDPAVLAGPLTPVLDGLLKHDPADRLTAREVEDRLREIVRDAPITPRTPDAPHRAVVPAQRAPEKVPDKADAPDPAAEVAPPPLPAAPERRSRLTFALVGLLLIALLTGAGVFTAHLMGQDRDTRAQSIDPVGSGTPTSAGSVAAGGAGGFSPLACDQPPSANAKRTPQPDAKATLGDWTLYSGFSYFSAPSGFHVGVPDGWTYEQIGTTVCFWDPGNIRVLSIDDARNPSGDPVKACRAEAERLQSAGALPEYRQIGITRAELAVKAADWEYRYTAAGNVRMHAKTRWFAAGGKAFALGWMTRDFEWDQNRATMNLIQSSFQVD
jgi:tRNA A-37 threonylcarbamoyl transferase component Bud32